MSLFIKICGMTSRVAVQTAIEARVNAVGFVFAPSKREVTPAQACELAEGVPAHIARVAVMQHPSQAQLDAVLLVFKPDVLQIDWEDLAQLRVPAQLTIWPVLRARRAQPESLPPRFVFEGPVSGTGETTDWTQAHALARRGELILAGGLKVTNVAEAIARVQPFGVDVSSGVESAPGVKDPHKIIEFVSAARAAAAMKLES